MSVEMPPRTYRWLALLAGFTVLTACAFGASTPLPPTPPGGAQNPYPLLRDLQTDPAATLRMPGADELTPLGSERYRTLQGYRPPSYGAVFGTQATSEEVYAFYDRELRSRGWQFVPGGADRGSVEERAWLWCASGAEFRLAIKEKDRAYEPAFYRGRTYQTVFEGTLFGRVPGEPCPGR